MRRNVLFTALFLFLLLVFNPSLLLAQTGAAASPAPITVNSFELFWPIAPGKVMGEAFYPLKTLKEKLRGMLIFDDFKKSDYNLTLSEKRVVEAEKLLVELKDYDNGKKTLDKATEARQLAVDFLEKSKDSPDAGNLKGRIISSLEKQRALLNYIITLLPEDRKSIVNENISSINELLAKLQ